MAGGRIDIEVDIDAKGLPAKLKQATDPVLGAAGKFAGALGLTFGALAAGNAVKDVIAIGNTFTENLNTMSAVSGATAEQLTKVSARAKELGNDIDLPGTSAADAAAAMSELAKGGFTVEQSMSAAKGTLQLAAAAQIDAASAATIQSQALQSFGLNADYAATASDVLANAANASSAEITDVASGLQQSGAVANQFGLTLEDTAAALGLLANSGIQGSDAGTLLKSALLALTDQSNPAQGAIEKLGLTVYDAQGQFVGLSELFGQLDEAAANMSPEMYQAATATLFGSDAMRLAGVAAEQGQAGYDAMVEAVNREGAAAEVAAAKTQGLPGAMGAVQNATEGLMLGLYDLIDGPLESLGRDAAEKISAITPAITSGLTDAATAAGDFLGPIVDFVGDAVGAFRELPGPIQAVGVALAALQISGGSDKIGGFIESISEKVQGFRDEMAGEIDMQAALGSISDADTQNPFLELTASAEDLVGAVEENAEPLSEMAAGLATLERRSPAVRNMADGYRAVAGRANDFAARQQGLATATGGVSGQLRLAAASAARFGGVVGGAAVAGVRGLGTAARGAVGALGGPWMVGIMAATVVVQSLTAASKRQSDQQDILSSSAEAAAEAQAQLGKAFQESQGAMSDQVLGAVVGQVDAMTAEIDQLASTGPGKMDQVISGASALGSALTGQFGAAKDSFSDLKDETADGAASIKERLETLGFTSEDLALKLTGTNNEFATFAAVLKNSGEGGPEAAAKLQVLRDEVIQARDVAKNTTPGFYDLQAAVKTLSDESSTAAERIDAMRVALDVLSGKPIPLSDAIQNYNRQIRETAADTAEVWDQTQGWADALVNADGSVNTASANGSRLRDTLIGIKDSTIQAAASGADMAPIWAQNEQAFQQLATATGVSVDAIRAMIEQEGLIQKNIEMVASLAGADSVEQQLAVIRGLLEANRNGVEIPVDALTDDAKAKLLEVGGKVEDVEGKPGIIRITAPTQEALDQIDRIARGVAGIQGKTVTVTVDTVRTAQAQRDFNAGGIQGPVAPILIPQNATGGPIKGPGTPTSDSILGLDRASGVATSWVSVDEFVVNAAAYRKHRGLVEAINADAIPVGAGMGPGSLPALAGGGAIARVQELGSQMNGMPYVWGGAGLAGADCSGWVAMLQRAAMGQEVEGRLGTTYTLLDGSWPGLVPGNQGPFVVGVNPDHMAATIAGENYESSDMVKRGGSSKGANDPSFTAQYYLPWELFSPPYSEDGDASSTDLASMSVGEYSTRSKSAFTEKDRLALESAKVAVTQAQDDLNAALANEKKSPADRDQARIKVQQAELKVKELEAKRDDTGLALAPDAPGLTTSYTDDEISRLEAKQAVEEARLDRNEVYAAFTRGEATEKEKLDADLKLQRAINREAEEGKSSSGSDSSLPTSWSDALGGIAKDFVSENVSDILGYYGVSDELPSWVKAGMAIGDAAKTGFTGEKPMGEDIVAQAPTFTPEDLAGQLPFTPGAPGTPDWLNNMIDVLRKPAKLFDTGGEWESGTLGYNDSGHRELVLNHDQRRETASDFALLSTFAQQFGALRNAGTAPASSDPFASRSDGRPFVINGADRREVQEGMRRARAEEKWEASNVRW